MGERLKNFPVSFFAVVMGMAGTAIAWDRAEKILGWGNDVSITLLILSGLIFLMISLIYFLKMVRHPDAVKIEFKNTTKLAFFPTISIGILLLSVATLGIHPVLSRYLWYPGAFIHLTFSIAIVSIWIRHPHLEINHINPAWFIPVVGNIIVPIAGVVHAPAELSWFFFSIGLILWIVLFTIIMYRLIFHNPLPEKLLPTLFILIAPPAVGFLAYVKLTQGIDPAARILYYFALFTFILMIPQFGLLSRIKYYLSWWAYTFPTAAMTMATILMYHQSHLDFFRYLALLLLAFLSLIILVLSMMTIAAIARKEICIEE
jgi:tellurite resistance protein